MIVNVVMLAKDRPRLTSQAMRTLGNNTPKDLYNLTIIDDASYNRVLPFDDNTAVLRLEQSRGITGQARNLGVYWAEKYWGRGDWLYLSDNDVYFTPGWLGNLTDIMKSYDKAFGIELLGGWNHQYLQPKPGREGDWLQYHDAVTGASQLMRWETWDKYGPLDAHAKGVCQGEDWQFCQAIVKDGGKVGSIYPRVVFNCGLTNSFGQPSVGADLVLKELQEAKIKYPDLYWE